MWNRYKGAGRHQTVRITADHSTSRTLDRAGMNSTLSVSVLLVILATVCLAKPLSPPHGRGGWTLVYNGKNPSANEAAALAGRASSLTAEQLIARLLPQLQEELANKENHYQLRDVLHQMRDRDYTGWMDFGRRSVEEYELDS